MATIKHYFPGGNTSKGFVNYFDGIIAPWVENRRIYVLKGGPGVGKNTFMKLFSKCALEKEYDLEYFHCASDVNSLDAVHIPKLGVTMLDGTAPHVIDPVTPGAIDGIINLGVYLNEAGLEKRRTEIREFMIDNSRCYKSTFAYLTAAGELQENSNYLYLAALDAAELRKEVQNLMSSYTVKSAKMTGAVRKLFLEAYTPQGYMNYMDTIQETRKIALMGPECIATEFIQMALSFASFMGYECQVFYSALLPQNPIHMIIEDLGLCLTTGATELWDYEKVIDLSSLLNQKLLHKYNDTVVFNDLYKGQLLEAAVGSLRRAKEIHDEIELIYRDNMDFEKATIYTEKFVKEFGF